MTGKGFLRAMSSLRWLPYMHIHVAMSCGSRAAEDGRAAAKLRSVGINTLIKSAQGAGSPCRPLALYVARTAMWSALRGSFATQVASTAHRARAKGQHGGRCAR